MLSNVFKNKEDFKNLQNSIRNIIIAVDNISILTIFRHHTKPFIYM